ncbi:MAG TPA: peptidoglycan-binding domain-containing protein [Streptosporangiaceae bacterium]|nr:peptidoglycan-binding domain-containing protein [Streptosporangiaceae bacterium]
MRLWKASSMVFMLVAPFAAGAVTAFPAAASADASSCYSYSFTNPYIGYPVGVPSASLAEGSTGDCVVILQQALNGVDHANLVPDGDFGPKTLTAVENYQAQHRGCTGGVDGIAGPYTMSCLIGGTG